jgi:hypothetical protein
MTCETDKKKETDKKETNTIELSPQNGFNKILQSLPLRKTPLIDTTNFDNALDLKEFNSKEIVALQLSDVYPNIGKNNYDFKFSPLYKLALSNNFHTIVLTVFKGDNELETLLITYNLKERLINHKIIAYDEIAEGWSRKHSKINNNNNITIIDKFYGEPKQIDTTKFHINNYGEINQIKTKYSSKLRTNQPIKLNQIYTDTIVFSSYDDIRKHREFFNQIFLIVYLI